MTAEYKADGALAVITLNNPPVNGLNLATRSACAEGIRRALADDAVKAIVLTGAGKAFSGGADIREFNSPKALEEPTLHTLIRMVEESAKPVVAAIHATCVGGGLELALGCHYRVAAPGAQIGLPEVKLGLLPGAGGTQRLPRAVGLKTALDMIVSGTPVPAVKLAGSRLFDRLIELHSETGFMQETLAFAAQIADMRPLPKLRDIKIEQPDAQALLDVARSAAAKNMHHLPAPLRCVEALAAAVNMPFEEGLAYERDLFIEMVQSTASKALRHAFFAERAAGKIADMPEDTPLRAITTAAVIGAGTMGAGIAMNFANAGTPVKIVETTQEALEKGLATIRRNYESTMKKGRLSAEECACRMAFISGTLAYEHIAQADIVIEAVFEDMRVKEEVFKKLDAVMRPGAILASNTSTLDLNRIAAATKRAHDVIGLHFFSPAHVMRLLEVVRGAQTGKDVLATAMALAKRMNKVGVVSGVCDGFIGNRMLEQYLRQAGFLLEEGALPDQVDKAIENFGFAMGPFRMSDLAGNDIGWAIRKRRYAEKPQLRYSKTADLLCEMGRFGQKTGAGWYDYREGERTPIPSQTVNDMIVKHSDELSIARRQIGDEEIVERLVYALVNEGARILEEGIAQRASDIDMVYLAGYGFPPFRGGPMFYADTVGLQAVLKAMEIYAQGRDGDFWLPADLLVRLVTEGGTFN